MKEIIRRVRNWLIVRLGGFTVQQMGAMVFQSAESVTPVKVEVRFTVDMWGCDPATAILEGPNVAKIKLAKLLAKEMVFNMGDAILIEQREDKINSLMEYRARAYILPAAAARIMGEMHNAVP